MFCFVLVAFLPKGSLSGAKIQQKNDNENKRDKKHTKSIPKHRDAHALYTFYDVLSGSLAFVFALCRVEGITHGKV